MTSESQNLYIDKLDDIVSKYKNTYHGTIKMKSVDAKTNTYVDSSKEINAKDPKFKIDDIVIISKHKNAFAKGYSLKLIRNRFLWLKKLNIYSVNGKEIFGNYYQKRIAKSKSKRVQN